MRVTMTILVGAYVLSQFYRAFLAVMTSVLKTDIGATPDDLAYATGLWFMIFAAMQIPVGWAIDRFGPKRLSAAMFGIGAAGGAVVFGLAQSAAYINFAMVLIGIGCSPILMAAYYIIGRMYPAQVFATMAAMVIGIGTFGNLAGSVPMAWAVDIFGWRETMFGLAAVTVVVAMAILIWVIDPPKPKGGQKGSILDLLKIPTLWLIFPLLLVQYAPAAGIRRLWAGPYTADVFGADAARIGQLTLIMGLAMIAGNFVYGPLDRIFGTRKWVIFVGNSCGALALFLLAYVVDWNIWTSASLMAAVGLCGASFPVIVAHARSFFPDHLMGRGVTLINLFGIGGVGILQVITGRMYESSLASGTALPAAYAQLFLFFAILIVIGLLIYAFAQDRND